MKEPLRRMLIGGFVKRSEIGVSVTLGKNEKIKIKISFYQARKSLVGTGKLVFAQYNPIESIKRCKFQSKFYYPVHREKMTSH